MDYYYGWQVSAVVMGGRDWFQALASAVGILGVAGSDAGHDSAPPFRAKPTRLIAEISDVEG